MATRLYALSHRREQLITRSDQQRAQIAQAAAALRRPLSVADSALRVVHFVRSHPIAMSLVAAGVVAYLRPKRVLRWASRAAIGIRVFTGIRKLFK